MSAETLAVAVLLAVFVNGMVEYIFKTACNKLGVEDTWWLMYVSLGFGLAVAFVYDINLFIGIGINTSLQHTVAVAMSGLVLGRGANYIADLPWPKAA